VTAVVAFIIQYIVMSLKCGKRLLKSALINEKTKFEFAIQKNKKKLMEKSVLNVLIVPRFLFLKC
jgi:hypothetical protein